MKKSHSIIQPFWFLQNKRIMEVRNLLSHCLVLISLVTPLIGLKITSLSTPSVETSPSLVAEASIAFNKTKGSWR